MNTLQDELDDVKKLVPNATPLELDLITAGFYQGASRLMLLIHRNKDLSREAMVALMISIREEIKSKADDYLAKKQ